MPCRAASAADSGGDGTDHLQGDIQRRAVAGAAHRSKDRLPPSISRMSRAGDSAAKLLSKDEARRIAANIAPSCRSYGRPSQRPPTHAPGVFDNDYPAKSIVEREGKIISH